MLVSEFIGNSVMKIMYSKVFLWNPWCIVMRMCRRIFLEKNMTPCRSPVRDNQIATSAKLLDIMFEFYGFGGDLIEPTN